MRLLILGPPGTGKTTTIVSLVQDLLAEGFDSTEIALVSFTKAAVGELRDRLAASTGRSNWPMVRTLHSICTQLTGRSRFMQPKHWKEFCQLARYDIPPEQASEDGLTDVPAPTEDSKLRAVHNYARSRQLPLDQAVHLASTRVDLDRLRKYVERLTAYKKDHDLCDFTDVIEEAVERTLTIGARAIVIDEAQDLSPLQIAFVGTQIDVADVAIVAGDDDQAIFEFQGASPEWIRALHTAPGWTTRILGQSWRCPERVRAAAMFVIARATDRVEKTYAPRPAPGTYAHAGLETAIDHAVQSGDSTMVLCRSGRGCELATKYLFRSGVPYITERGPGPRPYANAKLIDAIRTMHGISRGAVNTLAFARAVEDFCASAKHGGHIKHGGKKRISLFSADAICLADLDGMGLSDFSEAITSDPWAVFTANTDQDVLQYLRTLWRGHGHLPEPTITVTTWHSSKGREAHRVIVYAGIPRVCAEAIREGVGNSEHRAAYVAMTRAKQTLCIASAVDGCEYPFP